MPLGPQNQGQRTSTILTIIHVRSTQLRHRASSEMCQTRKCNYSITSSARASIDGGIGCLRTAGCAIHAKATSRGAELGNHDIDQVIEDLTRQSRWAAVAAMLVVFPR